MEHISVYLDRIRTHMLEESAQTDPGPDQDETPTTGEILPNTDNTYTYMYM